MAIGRLFHLGFDAVLVSTVIAGIRRTTGFTPDTKQITNDTARSIAEGYLGIGESVYDMVQGSAVTSKYFKKETR